MSQQQQICTRKDEWYTPPWLIDLARLTLGNIRWDLASSDAANRIVQAEQFFSLADSFLCDPRVEWYRLFWCNPPFSQVKAFAQQITHTHQRRTIKGIVLTNANTDSGWWQSLANAATYTVLLRGRISFLDAETLTPQRGNPKGQSLFLFNCEPDYFQQHGIVLWKTDEGLGV